jgi:hypothetical protein
MDKTSLVKEMRSRPARYKSVVPLGYYKDDVDTLCDHVEELERQLAAHRAAIEELERSFRERSRRARHFGSEGRLHHYWAGNRGALDVCLDKLEVEKKKLEEVSLS